MSWRHHRGLRRLIITAATILLLWMIGSLVLMILGAEPRFLRISGWCKNSPTRDYYCGQVEGFVKGPLILALGLAVFLFWRYLRVRRWYRRNALRNRRMVVPTADPEISRVRIVGRDELCELIMQRLRDEQSRRPLLLVGSIGTGKTATLVRLSEMLLATNVIPVGIDLRTVASSEKLNFRQLALEQFESTIDGQLHGSAEADKVWRRLHLENRIVVVADGLEEVLTDTAQPADRDSVLREAFRRATRDRLPLVVASRPDDPLRGLDALLLQLEPLAPAAALEYVQAHSRRSGADERWDRIAALVKAADVADSPFFLRVIGELYEVDRLDRLPHSNHGRSLLRWVLLEEWRDAVISGDLYEDYGMPAAERAEAIEVLSALACIGLRDNRQRIRTTDLATAERDPSGRWILAELRSRLHKLDAGNLQDVGLAETTGNALNIVVKMQDGVRFQHGVVQAYLGARFLTAALRDAAFLDHAFSEHDGPGRELLAALTLYTRSDGTLERRDGRRRAPVAYGRLLKLGDTVGQAIGLNLRVRDAELTRHHSVRLVRMLRAAAVSTRNRTHALEMFAAALEMDAATGHVQHRKLADAIGRSWPCYQGDGSITDRPLEDAKIALVHRYGDAAHQLRHHPPQRGAMRWRQPTPQYRQLFQMMADETSYLPRLAAAREIARGGSAAARNLGDWLGQPPWADSSRGRERLEEMRAWILPPLFLFTEAETDSIEQDLQSETCGMLRHLVRRLATDSAEGTPVSEMTLAQGFRLAANCRAYPPHRSILIEEAEKALRHSRFWYSHLVLIQALTLLALPRDPGEPLRKRGHGSDPRGLVEFWISIAGEGHRAPETGGGRTHPLVRAAADLCVEALIDRHPERHCWVDERQIVGRVGSVSAHQGIRRLQDSWLPPSHGWAVLEPRAQRLLADVMLLMNLADRGRDAGERALRLGRASRSDLPPCITTDRSAMRVTLSRRQAHDVQPGATCIDDCQFRLCPLPPKGDELPYQMDEAFCAHQIDLVGHLFRSPGRADWQAVDREELRSFWRDMSERMAPAWRK
ncbi:NACHT domain-containing protein [Verrucosispora sp. WMMA2044]|uniref:NACHT domain-containing protein n=1 Tax=Verrucosispora sp. WMMA2044 TaxID=3016419 RepID=UPI00248C5B7D|nr:NACHT domain-containing protein [Verrucosispora sp. WMMA2044]WBB47416.1 NACHT domain-containing protein [Verrucosispora sp. WMMA2044]